MLELQASQMGTLELDGQWVPYIDLNDESFQPTRVMLGNDEYAYESSVIIFGHSATLPQHIRRLRTSGRKPLVIERNQRYYTFVTPP